MMLRMALPLFVFLFSLSLKARAESFKNRKVLKVLTYNIKALPSPVGTNHWRYKEIGKVLKKRRLKGDQPDLVFLQEAFSSHAEELNPEAGYPYKVYGAEGDWGVQSSGLVILSDHKLKFTSRKNFNDCASWDCLANKGLLKTQVEVKDFPFALTLLNTHMQASSKHYEVRISQIEDTKDFKAQNRLEKRLQIFAGDFNSNKTHKRASYDHFRQSFPYLQDSSEDCLWSLNCQIEYEDPIKFEEVDESSVDRQFYFNPHSNLQMKVLKVIKNFNEKVYGVYLSDHWGYEVHYELSW